MSIEAMEQWLEALEQGCVPIEGWMPDIDEAITALRQAIAEAKKQKPLAWMDREGDFYKKEPPENWCPPHTPLYPHPQSKAEQEPVAFASHGVVNWIADKQFQHEADLYTHPQPKAEQEPVAMQMDVIVVNLVREGINKHRARELAEHFIKHAQPTEERNFCSRCGKRTNDIHTCTPPKEEA